MANYFVIDNTFRPYSFDELIKPYQMYGEAYRQQEALLDAARDKEFSVDSLDQVQDKVAYDMYNNAANQLKAASDELATRGLSSGLRSRIRTTARDYQTTMTNLNNAQQRLYAEQDRRAKLGPGYVYQQENLRIGDFLNGASPNPKGAKLSDVTADIAAEFQTRAKTISQDTWNKVLNQNGKVINGYYDVKTESGLKEAQLDTILQLSNPEGWNRFVASNPTITEEQKRELSGFVNSINSEMDAVGYGNYSTNGQKEIWNAIVKGAHAGLGGEEHKYQVDRSYNPELFYRMQRDKKADEEKAAQKRVSEGKDPFYTDPEGNKWYSDGNLIWEHDKDGKEIMKPTPRTKIGSEATPTETKEEKKAREAMARLTADQAFPLYTTDTAFGWFKSNDKTPTTAGGKWDYNERKGTEVSLEEFGAQRQDKLRSILADLNKSYGTNLTLSDVKIYKDWDVFSNEYKIVLNGREIGSVDGEGNPIVPEETVPNVPTAPTTATVADSLTTHRSSVNAGNLGGW